MKKSQLILPALVLGLPLVRAHCPLCTAGVAVAAGGAYWLGVNMSVIGLLVGAFAISTGWWVSKLIKREYFRYQRAAFIIASFALTVFPLLPLFPGITPWQISWAGEYGSLLNRTYLFNSFLAGSLIGTAIVSLTPSISRTITSWREGKNIPFQGVILTLVVLLATGLLLQFAL